MLLKTAIIFPPKWLAVGPGLGDREGALISALRRRHPGQALELLEIYEPNPDSCAVLTEKTRFEIVQKRSSPLSLTTALICLAFPDPPERQRYDHHIFLQ